MPRGGALARLGARSVRRRASCTSGTACAPSRCRSSWSRRRAPRSTRSTPRPRPPCTDCSSSTDASPACRPRSTCAPFARVEICGAADPARALARSLICSAATFHSPEHLAGRRARVGAEPRPLGLGQVAAARAERAPSDAVGPRGWCPPRPAWPTCCPPTSPTARFGAGEAAAIPHVLLVTDGATAPDGHRHGVTLLDLPARWDELEDPTTLRLRLEGEPARGPSAPAARQRVREEPVTAGADQCTPATAEALARRLTPLRAGDRRRRRDPRPVGPPGAAGPGRPPHPGPAGRLAAPPVRARPAARPDRPQRRTGRWCTSTSRSPPSRAWARTGW